MASSKADKKVELSTKQKNQIRSLFYKRVPDVDRRSKIVRLAQILSDEFNSGDFWALVYHYSLEENWPDLEKDFQRYGSIWDADTEINSSQTDLPPNSRSGKRRKK